MPGTHCSGAARPAPGSPHGSSARRDNAGPGHRRCEVTEGRGNGEGTGAVLVGRGEVQRGGTRLKLSGRARPLSLPFPPRQWICAVPASPASVPPRCAPSSGRPRPPRSGGGEECGAAPEHRRGECDEAPRAAKWGGGHKVTMPRSLPRTGGLTLLSSVPAMSPFRPQFPFVSPNAAAAIRAATCALGATSSLGPTGQRSPCVAPPGMGMGFGGC